MSSRERWCVVLVAGAGASCLLLPADWAVPLALCSAIVLLAILHGHATGCPACGKWWSKAEVEKRLVAQAGFDEGGIPVEKPLDRTTYQCSGCGYRWSVTDTLESRGPFWGRPQPPGR
jgi:hypothetical protein